MRSDSDSTRIDLLPVVTLVLWLTCLVVGLVGHYVSSAPPAVPVAIIRPTDVTLVKLALTDSATGAPARMDQVVAPPPQIPPPPPQAAEPISPAIAFAVPVEEPVRVAPKAQPVAPKIPAPAAKPSPAPPDAGPVYQQISYGKGEGQQPKPDYPIESQLAGQEGTVVVRFVVGTDGNVGSTEVTKPCTWPLLNQAAARSIRETWSYSSGPVRYYQVSITYRRKAQ